MASAPISSHRFFLPEGAVGAGTVAFTAEQQQQIRKVLRLRDGDRVIACPGDGTELIVILRLAGSTVSGAIDAVRPGLPEPSRPVWLYQSALRGDRFTWLLQKGTEIGVAGFVPVRYRYTQPADYATKLGRYLAVVREAAEQCGRSILPAVLPAAPFESALASTAAGSLCLLLDEAERARSLVDVLTSARDDVPAGTAAAAPLPVCLFVGPEGGLHPDERGLALARGVAPVSLGSRILRSETAGLVAATLALAASGDLGLAPRGAL